MLLYTTHLINVKRVQVYLSLFLVVLTVAVFWKVTSFDFVQFDDDRFILSNPFIQQGLTLRGLQWAFAGDLLWDSVHLDYWQPMTALSRMMDFKLWAFDAKGHHLTNLILHNCNVLFLYVLLVVMTGSTWKSAWVAALFAIHPVQVDPVSWVSARKDVLSVFFGLLSLIAYARIYVRRPSTKTKLLVALFMTLAVMSKPMMMSLPFLMIVFDGWPLNRFSRKSQKKQTLWVGLVAEKFLFLFISTASVVITCSQSSVAVTESARGFYRVFEWPMAYFMYLKRMLFSVNLPVQYKVTDPFSIWMLVGTGVLFGLISFLGWRKRKLESYWLAGWLWFLIALAPAVPGFRLGVANRFMYFPMIGLLIALAWGVPNLIKSFRYAGASLAFLGFLPLTLSAIYTPNQMMRWQDSVHLFEHAVSVNENDSAAHGLLGNAYHRKNDWDKALHHFDRAIELSPGDARLYVHRGTALAKQEEYDEAILNFKNALFINPNGIHENHNMGVTLVRMGKPAEAEPWLRNAIHLMPDNLQAYEYLAKALFWLDRSEEVVEVLTSALKYSGPNAKFLTGLGDALVKRGDANSALSYYQEALKVNPSFPEAHLSLGSLLAQSGHFDVAIPHLQQVLAIDPKNSVALDQLRIAQQSLGQKRESSN